MANTKSVSEKIAADEYRTKLPWFSRKSDPNGQRAYLEDATRLVDKRAWVLATKGLERP